MMGNDNVEFITSWRANPADGQMTIFELLRSDHEEILDMCRSIQLEHEEGLDFEAVDRHLLEIKQLFSIHSKAEEVVLYNALHDRSIESQDEELRFEILESFEEHHMVNQLFHELSMVQADHPRWLTKMQVLTETLQRHIQKEESQMFQLASRELASRAGQDLALEFLEEKDSLLDKSSGSENEWETQV